MQDLKNYWLKAIEEKEWIPHPDVQIIQNGERRVFYIDLSNLPETAEVYIERMREFFAKKQSS